MKSLKINKYLLITIAISLCCISCNKDEASNMTESSVLGDFELNISNITLRSAILSWTEPENNENSNLTYEVYLDEILIEERITDFQYIIKELEKGTNYSIKVIVKNTEKSVEKSLDFTTLEEAALLLTNLGPSHNKSFQMYFTYNEYNRIVKKEVLGCSETFNTLFTLNEYYYDVSGKIMNETANSPYGGLHYTIDYSYNGDSLTGINKEESFSTGSYTSEYSFNSSTEYNYEIQYFDTSGIPTYSKFYNCTISLDNDGRITRIIKNETTGSDYEYLNFDYNNGNLISISFEKYPFTLQRMEIEYDDKPSFHTYFSGSEFPGYTGNSCLRWDIMGLIQVEYFNNWDGFYDILPFYRNTNENNPLRYFISGSSNPDIEFTYEFNNYDYPKNVRINNSPNTMDFTYEVIE